MNIETAYKILDCKTNEELAKVHNDSGLEIENVKKIGQRAIVYYKNETHIKSLSLPAALLKPGGRIC